MSGSSFFRKVGLSLTCAAMTSFLVGISAPLQVLAADPALPLVPKKSEPAPKPVAPPAALHAPTSPFTLSFLPSKPLCPEVHTKEELAFLDIAGVTDSVPANSALCPSGAPQKSVWASLFPEPSVPEINFSLKEPVTTAAASLASTKAGPASKTTKTGRKISVPASQAKNQKASGQKASKKIARKAHIARHATMHRSVTARHGHGLRPAVVSSSSLRGYVVMRAAVFANKTELQTYREMGVPSAIAAMAHKRVVEMVGENVKPSAVSVVYKTSGRARLAAVSVVANGKAFTTVLHAGKASPAQTTSLTDELHGTPTILSPCAQPSTRAGRKAHAYRQSLRHRKEKTAPSSVQTVPQQAPVSAPTVSAPPAPQSAPKPAVAPEQPLPQLKKLPGQPSKKPLPLRAPGVFI